MMIKLKLYLPQGFADNADSKAVEKLLEDIKSNGEVIWEKIILDQKEEADLKSKILINISICKGIAIKQSRKSKMLYPQLVVFSDDEPIIFYPQERAGKKIDIQEFLKGLLRKEFKSLRDIDDLERAKILDAVKNC
jgi:hypothetical protein